jgi:hypothetical protein
MAGGLWTLALVAAIVTRVKRSKARKQAENAAGTQEKPKE